MCPYLIRSYFVIHIVFQSCSFLHVSYFVYFVVSLMISFFIGTYFHDHVNDDCKSHICFDMNLNLTTRRGIPDFEVEKENSRECLVEALMILYL